MRAMGAIRVIIVFLLSISSTYSCTPFRPRICASPPFVSYRYFPFSLLCPAPSLLLRPSLFPSSLPPSLFPPFLPFFQFAH
ncbi:hypothetical protein DFH06DRAFT_1190987 [Mycena polygramma]|nr:hypothetical protein DFH06DRAFT_1190987 [Mycena polygramma]